MKLSKLKGDSKNIRSLLNKDVNDKGCRVINSKITEFENELAKISTSDLSERELKEFEYLQSELEEFRECQCMRRLKGTL